jgi:DNA-3-methyladenine glycosylase I
MKIRCAWANDPQFHPYHDEEWGVPVHDDRKLFEFLVLESAQAGLSWATILHRREGYRQALENFDPQKVALFDEGKIILLLQDRTIIRNKLKITSAINNACRFLEIQKEFGSFDRFIWAFIGSKPIQNHWQSVSQIPARTEMSEFISRDLKRRGFTFVGPTILYAFMQAVGLVNDHEVSCFRFKEVRNLA